MCAPVCVPVGSPDAFVFVLLPAADTYINARDWLMSAFDLTEDQALTLMTVACDFQVHQVVDGNCE